MHLVPVLILLWSFISYIKYTFIKWSCYANTAQENTLVVNWGYNKCWKGAWIKVAFHKCNSFIYWKDLAKPFTEHVTNTLHLTFVPPSLDYNKAKDGTLLIFLFSLLL